MSRPQHMEALIVANSIRYAKADLKRVIRELDQQEGMALVADLVDGRQDHGFPEDAIEAMKFGEMIGAISHIGVGKANQLARHVGVFSQDRKLRDLTRRQRVELAFALRHPRMIWPGAKVGGQVAA